MSLEFRLEMPQDVYTRKRYYNTTYNTRHGKRKNLNATSHIKQLEGAARDREQAIEKKIRAFEANAKVISERALARTVMDDRTDAPGQFRTKKNMPITQEFIAVRNRNTEFRESVRSLMCLNQAITALKSNEQSKEGTPVRQTRNHCNPYSSSSSSTSKMPPKKKPRIPPLPTLHHQHSKKAPQKRRSTLVKLPSIPVTFRSLEQNDDTIRPLSYSDFLLGQVNREELKGLSRRFP